LAEGSTIEAHRDRNAEGVEGKENGEWVPPSQPTTILVLSERHRTPLIVMFVVIECPVSRRLFILLTLYRAIKIAPPLDIGRFSDESWRLRANCNLGDPPLPTSQLGERCELPGGVRVGARAAKSNCDSV